MLCYRLSSWIHKYRRQQRTKQSRQNHHSVDSLGSHFEENSKDFTLANYIIEYHFHWEVARILRDFRIILKPL